MTQLSTQDAFHQLLGKLDRGDFDVLAMHPGMHETRQHFPQLHAAFPDLHQVVETEFVDGEMIAAVVYVEGTHQGPYWGVAPTGKRVRFRVLMIEQIVDGTVVLHHAAPDFLGLFAQIGAPLQPAAAVGG